MNIAAAGREPSSRLVFVHLPKTGGTSLHAAFARHFPAETVLHANGAAPWAPALTEPGRYRYVAGHMRFSLVALVPSPRTVVTVLREPASRILSLYTFWKRHQDPTRPQLREAMEKDLLDFLRSTDPAVRAGIDNAMARQLFGNAFVAPDGSWSATVQAEDAPGPLTDLDIVLGALGNLLRCDAVGFMDDLPRLYRAVCQRLGVPPGADPERLNTREGEHPGLRPAEPHEVVTPEVQAELDRLTRLDRIVYELARAHFRAGPCPSRPWRPPAPHAVGSAWPMEPSGFVEAVYRGLFGRAPGPQGFGTHVVALSDGTLSPAEMLRRFLASEEFRDRLTGGTPAR